MKKYIIFFGTWLLMIALGFGFTLLTHLDLSSARILDIWLGKELFYEVLIGYAVSFALTLLLCLGGKA